MIEKNVRSGNILDDSGIFQKDAIFFADLRSRTTDMERTHRELCTGLTDGLRGDNTDGFTDLDDLVMRKISSIALHANAVFRFAGENGSEINGLDAGSLDFEGKFVSDEFVNVDNDIVGDRMNDALKGIAAGNTVMKGFDDFLAFLDGRVFNTVDGTAILFIDDDILRNINQTGE